MCASVRPFAEMNISEASGPIATEFYLKHHWVGEKDALGLGERGCSVVERRIPEREVGGSKPTPAVLCL